MTTNSWQTNLKGDPLPWLLEPDEANPGVRYFALRTLLDRPTDDPDVVAAQEAVMTSGPVPVILQAQTPAGYWIKPGGGYSPKYQGTVWQVMFLAELGADPADERVRRGGDYLLNHSLAANGAFSARQKPVPSSTLHCLNGNLLFALLRLGFAADPRVQTALDWQARAITGQGPIEYFRSGTSGPGFACAINQGQPCGWGAVKGMKALLSIPPEQRTAALQAAINTGAEFLLSRDPALANYPYTDRVSSSWFKFGYPLSYWSDVLEVALVLAQLGYGADPRLSHTLDYILNKQDHQGRWRLENSLNGKMWVNIERKGHPSKWITLRVLQLLKTIARKQP